MSSVSTTLKMCIHLRNIKGGQYSFLLFRQMTPTSKYLILMFCVSFIVFFIYSVCCYSRSLLLVNILVILGIFIFIFSNWLSL